MRKLGQNIKTLVSRELLVGNYEIRWDGQNEMGQEVSSGVYFIQLQTNENTLTMKILLIR